MSPRADVAQVLSDLALLADKTCPATDDTAKRICSEARTLLSQEHARAEQLTAVVQQFVALAQDGKIAGADIAVVRLIIDARRVLSFAPEAVESLSKYAEMDRTQYDASRASPKKE